MYCPKCGLQQITDVMRFCSRCGLPISGLAEWLASGGGVLALGEEEAPLPVASPRRRGISRGAKLIFISVVLVPIFFGLSILVDNPIPLMLPFTLFLAGLSIMLYSRLFGEEIPSGKSQQAQPFKLRAMPESKALPPASNNWMNWAGGQRVRTSELAQPPSVTEHTTRLLDNE